jgi:ribonuclease G
MFGRRMRSRIQLYEGIAPIFEHFDLERKIEESFRRRITLKSGGYIIFEETEAMIAVDVNTGRHKAKSHEDAILEVNMEAVDEVARQLRLRNVGGLVLIDLVDMASKKHQNMVYRAFRDAMRKDKARTNVLPISKLGVLEMSRQRVEESILSSTYCVCPYCDGRGRVKSPLTTSAEIQRHIAAVIRKLRGEKKDIKLQILVHPSVLERLRQEDEAILIDMESRLGARLTFRGDPARHYEGFTILDADTGGVLYSAERQVAAFTQQRNAEQRNVDHA